MARSVEANHSSIIHAASLLGAGEVVAFPTETVYGLGADTLNTQAIEKIYKLKDRPTNNPLIAHVLNEQQAQMLVKNWDERCRKLVNRFWPGPLTLVLDRSNTVPAEVTAGLDTIALRSPAHEVARQLLKEFGRSISAPSANKSGHISPTSAKHVFDDYQHEDDLFILDGGRCEIGIESTVLDLTSEQPSILRLGAVTAEQLQEVIGKVTVPSINEQTISPGTSVKHYSPTTPVVLVDSEGISQILKAEAASVSVLCFKSTIVSQPHLVIVMPDSAKEYAAYLYEALREADSKGLARIVIEIPSCSTGNWAAICDRIMRAASDAHG